MTGPGDFNDLWADFLGRGKTMENQLRESVLWGNPGTRQKEIRAVVSRFPYLDVDRNEEVDVSTIPRPGATT